MTSCGHHAAVVQAGEAEFERTLPRHGVSLFLLEAQAGGA